MLMHGGGYLAKVPGPGEHVVVGASPNEPALIKDIFLSVGFLGHVHTILCNRRGEGAGKGAGEGRGSYLWNTPTVSLHNMLVYMSATW